MVRQAPPPAETPALRLDRVTRRFAGRGGPIVALDRVSLRVPQRGVFGVLGPNGAGKTTLLRVVCGLLRPTEGRVEVLGEDPVRRPAVVRRALGAGLGGERALYWRLTGRENLLYAAALYDLPASLAASRAAELLRFVDLAGRADDLVGGYSTGMRQRLALARALVHDPALLILDEPTAGLDPHGQAAMRGLLEALARDRGRTIVMATNNLLDADRLCDTVAIIDRGRLLAEGAPRDLRAAVTRPGGPPPTLEDVFLAATGRPPAAGDRAGAPA
jgi:ABC-2 type transport system ATP-binding protein